MGDGLCGCPEAQVVELESNRIHLSWRLMEPSIAVVFTTENVDGTFNVAPFSWVKPTSQDPPLITASLLSKPRKQRSLENIERTREFVVNVPGLNMVEVVALCGQKVPDGVSKLELTGVPTAPSRKVSPPRLAHARAYLECRAVDLIGTGDHCLIVAEIVAAGYDERCYSPSLLLMTEKSGPCIHLEQYNRRATQVHVFMECGGARLVETRYLLPMSELMDLADTT